MKQQTVFLLWGYDSPSGWATRPRKLLIGVFSSAFMANRRIKIEKSKINWRMDWSSFETETRVVDPDGDSIPCRTTGL